jgi:SAM-dependent methyltransferase
MPFPVRGLADLYGEEDYFDGHDLVSKKRAGLAMLERFERRLGRRGRYLDVGCGRGEFLWAARQRGWECEGVDPSPAFLEWGRRHLGVEGRFGTLDEVQFPDAFFDAVTMGGVVEHLFNPYEVLREVWRVLRPGGLLWFDAPNEDGLFMRLGNLYVKGLHRDWVVVLAPTFPPYHVQGFNRRSLGRLLGRAGFELLDLKVWGALWPLTGRPSLGKRFAFWAGKLVNWIGNRCGAGTYMEAWARKPGG